MCRSNSIARQYHSARITHVKTRSTNRRHARVPHGNTGTPPVPHVGGPVTGPGVPTVLIGGMPAAVVGDMSTCVGPPDSIVLGSTGVLIGGKPASRMGDMCAHSGTIVVGCPTVLIGEVSPGGPPAVVAGAILSTTLQSVKPPGQRGPQDAVKLQNANMLAAAMMGTAFVHDSCSCAQCGS